MSVFSPSVFMKTLASVSFDIFCDFVILQIIIQIHGVKAT